MTNPKSDLIYLSGEGLLDNDSSSTVASVLFPKRAGRLSIVDTLLKVTTAINTGLTAQPLINIYRHTVAPSSVLNPTTGLVGIHDYINKPILADDIAGTLYPCAAIGELGGKTIIPSKYQTGTVSVTASSATITGVGTTFAATDVGKVIALEDGQVARISAYSSATSVTADKNFATTSATKKFQFVAPNPRTTDDLANGFVQFTATDYLWIAISTEGSGGTVAGAIQGLFAVKFDETVLNGHYLT